MKKNQTIIVTGVTGYIGGRLVPKLIDAGYDVRVLVRDPDRLKGRSWVESVEIAKGDVLKPETLPDVLRDTKAAYYLIHSMSGSDDFHQRDLIAARNFGEAAKDAGVEQIIYLGGLGDPEANLSEHLKSRQETGRALAEAGVPVTEFRAAIIVGSGSISFEMIRNLSERIPIMICPRWVFTRVQPIAIQDVLAYLVNALRVDASKGKVIEIGGADVLTYGDMMTGYAEVRGLKRYLISVPVLTPRLSSYWVHWMTPVSASITRPLVEGLRNEVVLRDDGAQQLFPDIQPVDYKTAVERALEDLNLRQMETRWTDSLISSKGEGKKVFISTQEGIIAERRQLEIEASPEQVFKAFSSLGGEVGWTNFDWLWRIRGRLDRLIGGVGLRRGRRDPVDLRVGDALDFWRVEAIEPGKMLRLRAEMKVPGQAWLQFDSLPMEAGKTQLVQTAFFVPKGLFGLLYWYVLYPVHAFVFSGLTIGINQLALK